MIRSTMQEFPLTIPAIMRHGTSVYGGITEADRALAIVPMFHANAWGLPYAAFLSGATLHMPGPFLQPEHLTKVHRRRTDHGDLGRADHLERDR